LLATSFVLTAASVSTAVFGHISGPFVGLLLTYIFQLNNNVTNYVIASTNI
jgi:ABC-type multidrug transport system fused ATPase/permease subunit